MYEKAKSEQRGCREPGPQGDKLCYNTPYRAWKTLFTDKLLSHIIKCTNEYGWFKQRGDRWEDVNREEMMDFIMILYMSSVRHRTDPHSTWFNDDPFRNIPMFKQIMPGKLFWQIVQCLHVCELRKMGDQRSERYNPNEKFREFLDLVEE